MCRTTLPAVVFAWRNLSANQQLNWRNFLSYSPDFMKKSPKTLLSAYSLFVKYNTIRVLSGWSILEDIYFYQPNLSPLTSYPYLDDGEFYIDVGQEIPGLDWYYQIRISRPCNGSHSRELNNLRIIRAYGYAEQYFSIDTAYRAVYGTIPAAGQWISYEVKFFHYNMPFIYGSSVQKRYV
jgi:hypothetical protein